MESPFRSSWKNGLISGCAFFLSVGALSVWYAALSSGLTASDTVGSGSGLTSASWNRIVNGVLELDTRTAAMNSGTAKAWANFSATSCSPNCTIRAGYNVASVSRVSAGVYNVTLANALSDANYAVTGTAEGTVGYNGWLQTGYAAGRTASTFQIATVTSGPSGYGVFDSANVNFAVFR